AFGADADRALVLVLGPQALGPGHVLVLAQPDAAGRDAERPGPRLVVFDAGGGEEGAHVVGFVVRDVAQVEQQFRHRPIIAASARPGPPALSACWARPGAGCCAPARRSGRGSIR